MEVVKDTTMYYFIFYFQVLQLFHFNFFQTAFPILLIPHVHCRDLFRFDFAETKCWLLAPGPGGMFPIPFYRQTNQGVAELTSEMVEKERSAMANQGMQRTLKVIFSADVNGYSKLMGYDEEYTVDKITAYRDTIALLIENNHGRVVDAPGDNILAEFDNPLDAIDCAVETQRTLKTENGKLPDNRRMDFRIGINMGDVLHKDDRIYGHSVNIAARIENLADPGGICISKGVYDQVEGKLDLGFADLGPHSVKNIEKPVRIYKVLLSQADIGKVVRSTNSKASIGRWIVGTAMAFVVAAGVAGVWYQPFKSKLEPAAMDRMAYPLPDRPSIAVLPFENDSDDAKLNFFARGLTEDLTASLSKAPDLFVIARTSAATYQGKPFDFKQVAEEQGIQYVMEGSVRKEEDKLRITVQLIDALNGRNLWADRFDRRAKDIFALQDEIVKHVMVELQVKLTHGASARVASRGTDSLDAWLLKIEAHGEFAKFTREGMVKARELYEASHDADPGWARPLAGLAAVDWYEAKQGWSVSKEASIQSGIELAKQAMEMDPDDPIGYQTLGNLYALNGQGERAIALRRKAVELAPNDLAAVAGLATRLKDFGGEQEAVKLFEQAMRLSPKHPWWVPYAYGVTLHLVGRKEEAIESFKKAIALNPTHVLPRAFLTAVYADLGRIEEAKTTANEVIRLEPKFTATRLIRSHTLHDPARDAQLRNLLHRAGLPQ